MHLNVSKQAENDIYVRHTNKKHSLLKFKKIFHFHGRFYCKKRSMLILTLFKMIGKGFKLLKNSNKTGDLSQIYDASNLLFRFTSIWYRSYLLNVV